MLKNAQRQILTCRHEPGSADHPTVSEDGGGACAQVKAPPQGRIVLSRCGKGAGPERHLAQKPRFIITNKK
jgi:hypothetical protein